MAWTDPTGLSPKELAGITARTVTTGGQTTGGLNPGTPADFSLPLVAIGSESRVIEAVPAAATEWPAFSRRYMNLNNAQSARLQAHVRGAASAGATLRLRYSLNGGATFADTGIVVPIDAIANPAFGAYLAVVAGAKVSNALVSLFTQGGDGVTAVEIGDVIFDVTSSATPPASVAGAGPANPIPVGLYYDHDPLYGMTVNPSGRVRKILDRNGGANNYVENTSDSGPFLVASVLNGFPVVRHQANGVTGLVLGSPTGFVGSAGPDNWSLVIVARHTGVQGTGVPVLAGFQGIAFPRNGHVGVISSGSAWLETSTTASTSAFQIVMAIRTSGTLRIYVDNVLASPTFTNGFGTGTGVFYGREGANTFDGDWARSMGYNVPLTDADRTTLYNSLKSGYGL